eukprot:3934946-Rhodomonas_salina.6
MAEPYTPSMMPENLKTARTVDSDDGSAEVSFERRRLRCCRQAGGRKVPDVGRVSHGHDKGRDVDACPAPVAAIVVQCQPSRKAAVEQNMNCVRCRAFGG